MTGSPRRVIAVAGLVSALSAAIFFTGCKLRGGFPGMSTGGQDEPAQSATKAKPDDKAAAKKPETTPSPAPTTGPSPTPVPITDPIVILQNEIQSRIDAVGKLGHDELQDLASDQAFKKENMGLDAELGTEFVAIVLASQQPAVRLVVASQAYKYGVSADQLNLERNATDRASHLAYRFAKRISRAALARDALVAHYFMFQYARDKENGLGLVKQLPGGRDEAKLLADQIADLHDPINRYRRYRKSYEIGRTKYSMTPEQARDYAIKMVRDPETEPSPSPTPNASASPSPNPSPTPSPSSSPKPSPEPEADTE
jgi:hypothetical protein